MSQSIDRDKKTVHTTHTESETQLLGEDLAARVFESKPVFIQLKGPLGAGKTAFARGFVRRWSMLAGDEVPETVVSPTYNIVKVYGNECPLAHFDLYRIRNWRELEEIGVEQYFFGMSGCLVEWLENVEEAAALKPAGAIVVEIEPGRFDDPGLRTITIEGLKKVS